MPNKELNKKEKVIAAAIRLFVAKGFDRVSTSEISKTAGVATGTMFHYFSSKDEIIIAAYKEAKHNFICQTAESDVACSVKDRMQLIWDELIHWALKNQDEFYYIQQFSSSPYYSKGIMGEDDNWITLLDWWNDAIQKKELKMIPVDFLLKLFTSLLYTTIEYLIQNTEKTEEYLETSYQLCWDMISNK